MSKLPTIPRLACLVSGLAVIAAACFAPMAVGRASAASSGLSTQDQAFMADNAQTDMAEITAGQTMQTKGASAAVRSDAGVVITDHTSVLDQLKALATQTGDTLPTTVNATQQQEAATVTGDPSGPALDAAYSEDEIKGHETSIAQTQAELSSGSDPAVVQFARMYLPIAQKHLQMYEADGAVSPSSVTAGTGGAAAPHQPVATPWIVALGGVGLLLAGWSGVRLRRRQLT